MIQMKSVRFALYSVPVSSTGFYFPGVLSVCGKHRMRITANITESGRKIDVFVETEKGVSSNKTFAPPQIIPEKPDFEVLVNLYKIYGDLRTKTQMERILARTGILSGETILEIFLKRALERHEAITVVNAPNVQEQVVAVGYDGPTLDLKSVRQGHSSLRRVPGALVIPDIISCSFISVESEWW